MIFAWVHPLPSLRSTRRNYQRCSRGVCDSSSICAKQQTACYSSVAVFCCMIHCVLCLCVCVTPCLLFHESTYYDSSSLSLGLSACLFACLSACLSIRHTQGVSGRIVFGERLPATWFGGASLVVAGVALLIGGTGTSTITNDGDKTKASLATPTRQRAAVKNASSSPLSQRGARSQTTKGRPKRD